MMNITERELLERLRNNLMGREVEDAGELYDEIIIAFEDAEIDGEAEVVINEAYYENALMAHLNHIDSPVYVIEYEENEDGSCIVTNVDNFF